LAFGLIEPPEHVLQAHKMFISAGADRDGQQLCCGAFHLRHDHRRVLRYPP
jgi:L-asparaginase II